MCKKELTNKEIEKIYRQNRENLISHAIKYGAEPEEALDFVSFAFRQLIEYRGNIDRPLNWLYRVVRNACFTEKKRKKQTQEKKGKVDSESVDQIYEVASNDLSPEVLAEQKEFRENYAAVREQLSPLHRRILRLRLREELSCRKIARQLGLKNGRQVRHMLEYQIQPELKRLLDKFDLRKGGVFRNG